MKFAPAWPLFVFVLLLAIGPARADFKAAASFMTDAVYRGYSKNRNHPAFAGNLEYAHDSGIRGGLWVSQVSFDDQDYADRANVEINPYLGWTLALAQDWRADLAINGYVYDGKLFGIGSDYTEFAGALHFRELLTARFAYAYDAYGRKAHTFDYELTGRYALTDAWQVSAGLGFYQAAELLQWNNFYWNAGLTWYPSRHVAADLRYVDTTAGGYSSTGGQYYEFRPRPLDQPVLFTLSVGF